MLIHAGRALMDPVSDDRRTSRSLPRCGSASSDPSASTASAGQPRGRTGCVTRSLASQERVGAGCSFRGRSLVHCKEFSSGAVDVKLCKWMMEARACERLRYRESWQNCTGTTSSIE